MTTNLTEAESRELIRMYDELQRRKARNKLVAFTPTPKQLEFYESGKMYLERLFMAGNQIGKCVCYQTLIEHPNGKKTPIGKLYERRNSFNVIAWDGKKKVSAPVTHVIKKPAEPCVRIYLKSGDYLDCALNHRVLTSCGYSFVWPLLSSVPCLPVSDLASCQSIHDEGDPHCSGKASNYLARCLADYRQYGVQPPLTSNIDQQSLTSQDDAPQHIQPLLTSDVVCQPKGKHIHQRFFSRLSSLGAKVQNAVRVAVFLSCNVCKTSHHTSTIHREVQRLAIAATVFLRSIRANVLGQSLQVALVNPHDMAGNQIIAYSPIGVHDIYDMTVPEYSNYVVAGMVNHNTTAGAYEVAMHVTGLYPEANQVFYPTEKELLIKLATTEKQTDEYEYITGWLENLEKHRLFGADVYPEGWPGRRWDRPIKMWAAGKSSRETRDIVQSALFGEPENMEENFGTGAIPADCLSLSKTTKIPAVPNAIDTALVKHKSGGWSVIGMKAYDQGRERFQGKPLDLVWFDEEPPFDVYDEGKTRCNARRGSTMITFTPLKGLSTVVRTFIHDEKELV